MNIMCSIIGKADKLEQKIEDLSEDFHDKLHNIEDKLKESQSVNDQKHDFSDLCKGKLSKLLVEGKGQCRFCRQFLVQSSNI